MNLCIKFILRFYIKLSNSGYPVSTRQRMFFVVVLTPSKSLMAEK